MPSELTLVGYARMKQYTPSQFEHELLITYLSLVTGFLQSKEEKANNEYRRVITIVSEQEG